MLIELTKMMLMMPAPTQNEASAEARGEAFLAALEDMPVWAVRSAIRRWYRGDAGTDEPGEPFDYHWCPAPATFAGSRCVSSGASGRIAACYEGSLRPSPSIEFSR